jgi:hypothetical protein
LLTFFFLFFSLKRLSLYLKGKEKNACQAAC